MTGVLISLDEARASRAHGIRYREIFDAAESALLAGRFIALCGVLGSGKTMMMQRLQKRLNDENYVVVASLPSDKTRVTTVTLVTALLRALSANERERFPAEGEARARALRDLVQRRKRPVALFIAAAHNLRPATLIGIKRIWELIECDEARLSVALAGRPTLRTALQREELRYRADIFMLDGDVMK